MKGRLKLFMAIALLPFLFARCEPKITANDPPKGVSLHVGNVFAIYGMFNTTSYVSFKVKVKIQALDANHNATQYKPTVIVTYTSAQNVFPNGILDIPGVEVPSTGEFTVQVWEEATSCHWQESHCTNPYPNYTMNSYFSQQTFHAPVTSIVFNATFTLDDWTCC